MELTQIKWENAWTKIPVQNWKNWVESDLNLVADSKLAHFAEIEKEEWWIAKISTTHEDHHLKVNWRKIPSNQAKKIETWDTVSFWENRENVFAVHEKWEEVLKDDVKNHIEKSWHALTDEEYSDILKKLNLEEKIIRWLFVWLLAISIFLTWIIFYLNSQNSAVSKAIYETLNSKDEQIQELQELIWENPEIECDPEVENWCEIEWLDLFSQIQNLEEKNKELELQISNSDVQKILEEKISLLEEQISANQEIEFNEETKLELSNIIHNVVEEINSFKTEEESNFESFDNSENLEKISQLEETISEIQNSLSWEELDFWENWEKVWEAVKILLNKIMDLQNEVNSLK